MSNRGFISLIALLGAVVLFFVINIVAGQWLTGARADLTEGKLYTLSQGSRNIVKGLREPVKLTLYLTQKAANDEPLVKPYAQRVREMLGEFVRASDGKLSLTIVDPQPFSEEQDKADAAGIKAFQVQGSKSVLYFGLVGTNAVDKTESIPLLDPGREAFLEFDLAKMIFNLSDRVRSNIGLMTWLPLEGSERNPMTGGPGAPAWQIDKRIKEAFDVKPIATNAKEIPADLKVLVIVHPKSMSDQTQYAVDQFVMHGGRVLLFVDPNCDFDVPPGVNQFEAMKIPKASDLERLMNAWGVEMEAGKVAADYKLGIKQPDQRGNRQELQKRITWLSLDKSRRSAADPVTSQLEQAFVINAGVLKKKDGATTDVQPLFTTTDKQAAPIDVNKVSVFPEWKKLEADFQPGTKELWLAVRATGKTKSAFPDGPPPEVKPAPGVEAPKTPLPANYLAESKDPINVIVVADCDFLADMCWIQPLQMGGTILGYQEISDNGAFTVNAIDNLTGSTDLLSLRARGKTQRPFTRIKDIEEKAQKKYSEEQDRLETSLREIDQQISELLKQRPDAKDSRIVLTPDLQKKLVEAREKKKETRRELRKVEFNLNKDVDALKMRMMFYNIGLMPIIVGLFAIGLGAYRGVRRKADRQTASKG